MNESPKSPDRTTGRQHRNQRASVVDAWNRRDGQPTARHGQGKRWRARYIDRDGQHQERSFRVKTEAQAWLDERTASIVTGTHVAARAGRVTVGELASEYLTSKRATLTPKSAESLRSLIDSRVLPQWRTVPVGDVLPSDVQRWVSELVAAGLSPSRVRQCVHTLGAILTDAVRDRRIPSNPAALATLPRLTTKRAHRYLARTELDDLAERCGSLDDVVLTLGLTGMRWGELAGLRIGSVDFLRRRIRIDRATVEVGGKLVDGAPKLGKRREVAAPRSLLERLARRAEGRGPGELMFVTERGAQLRSRNFRRTFDPAVTAAGLAPLTVHELRHTAASLAIAAGASPLVVARMLGHSDPSITLKRYAGLFDDELDEIAERLDAPARRLRDIGGRKG